LSACFGKIAAAGRSASRSRSSTQTLKFSASAPQRWAGSAFHREELPARVFYAAAAEKRDRSIELCSKPLGSRVSMSTSLKPFGGPRDAGASTPKN